MSRMRGVPRSVPHNVAHRSTGKGVQRYRYTWLQGYRYTWVQGYRYTGVQGYRDMRGPMMAHNNDCDVLLYPVCPCIADGYGCTESSRGGSCCQEGCRYIYPCIFVLSYPCTPVPLHPCSPYLCSPHSYAHVPVSLYLCIPGPVPPGRTEFAAGYAHLPRHACCRCTHWCPLTHRWAAHMSLCAV